MVPADSGEAGGWSQTLPQAATTSTSQRWSETAMHDELHPALDDASTEAAVAAPPQRRKRTRVIAPAGPPRGTSALDGGSDSSPGARPEQVDSDHEASGHEDPHEGHPADPHEGYHEGHHEGSDHDDRGPNELGFGEWDLGSREGVH